ncbi:hypothetical protein [Endozoicomonas atrinae]|uniref:hypothetical protein n=1 Tax=Endozoicomonas atrinae TaxID=1333660 RepID=UPI003AFFB75F
MKRWQNNIPEYLISPLTTGFRKISIGVVKDSKAEVIVLIADGLIDNNSSEEVVSMIVENSSLILKD